MSVQRPTFDEELANPMPFFARNAASKDKPSSDSLPIGIPVSVRVVQGQPVVVQGEPAVVRQSALAAITKREAHAKQQAAGPAPVSLSLCRADAACAGCEYGVLFPGVVRCEPASAMRRAGESCRYRMNAWEGTKICLYRAGPAQALRLAEDGAPGSSERSRSEARSRAMICSGVW